MSYIVPTDNKWVTLYDVSKAINEHTDIYSEEDCQYAIKSFIVSNFSNVYLDSLNTSDNSLGKPYADNQFVKWIDLYRVEYSFYIDSEENEHENINEDYYSFEKTFIIYSYKTLFRNGEKLSSIPVKWHYTSNENGWKTNTPTSGSQSATTITIGLYENDETSQKQYKWTAIQDEHSNLSQKTIEINFVHIPKYGTISWNTAEDVTINSITKNVLKGLNITGNFNDSKSDNFGTDLENIQTAITISSSESWVSGISYDLSSCNIVFDWNTSETDNRQTVITLTINDPRLTLVGDNDFIIMQNKRIVTHDGYYLSIICDGVNSFGTYSCYGGEKSYIVHSYANEYYDGQYQFKINVPYSFNTLPWATINNTSMEAYRSVYNATNGSGKGNVTVVENTVEYTPRSGTFTFSQDPYSNLTQNVQINQNQPCMTYTFYINPTSKDVSGTEGGSFSVMVTSYKVMNGHTDNPIAVGYSSSCESDWIECEGNSSPSALTTNVNVSYDKNPSYERTAIIKYTQDGVNENGYNYTQNLTLNQSAGFIYRYVFVVNGTIGSSSAPTSSMPEFSYDGGTKSITIKSYAEVHVGSIDGPIDRYDPIPWRSTSCNWITNAPSSGNGTSSDSGTETVNVTASPQSEVGYDNSRCCNMIFTQNQSGNKVTVNACQERNLTVWTYTFYASDNSLSFGACSSDSDTSTVYSYKDLTRNGNVIYGNRTNLGYSVDTVQWATATDNSSPSSSATTTTITVDSNSNNQSSRNSYFLYTQSESNNTFRININQSGASCQAYGVGPLELNIGNGYKTSETISVPSGLTTLDVSFISPQYRSLCGISSNTKCPDGTESYKIDSIPSWISSEIGTTWSYDDDKLTINASDVASERTGTVTYTNGTYEAEIIITQAEGVSYTYYFKVNGTESSKVDPNHETSSTLSYSSNGGSQQIEVISYRTNSINGQQEPVPWSASSIGGTIEASFQSTGSGGTQNVTITTSPNSEETVKYNTLSYVQYNTSYRVDVPLTQAAFINRHVKWEVPPENTTLEISNVSTTVTAYASTTGVTADDCTVTVPSPLSVISVTQNTPVGTGYNAVKVLIDVPKNTSSVDKEYEIKISC